MSSLSVGSPVPWRAEIQDDYRKRSEEVVQNGVELLKEAREQGKDLKQFFFSLIDSLARFRHETAVAHGTEDAHLFGRNRMYTMDNVGHTCLGERDGLGACYKPYNDRMLASIQKIVKDKIPLKEDPSRNPIRIEEEYEGRKCVFQIEILSSQEIQKRQWDREIHDDHPKAWSKMKPNLDYSKMDGLDFPNSKADLDLSEEFHEQVRNLKKEYPAAYAQEKMHYMLVKLNEEFPSPKKHLYPNGSFSHFEGNLAYLKNIYILGTVRIEINGKMYALSQYLTWTYQDYQTCPVDRLKNSVITIIHQDRYLIEDTLQEAATVFEKALQWKKSNGDVEELKDQVALIRYLFTHAMTYLRGVAAIGEHLEKVIYRDRGLDCKHSKESPGDLEAFTAPLWSTFVRERYSSTIELK